MSKPPPKWRDTLTKKCAHCGETFWPTPRTDWDVWQVRIHCAKCASRTTARNRRFPTERDRAR